MTTPELLQKELAAVGAFFYQKGWCLATGGNFSARLDSGQVVITQSGKDKGTLVPDDMMTVDLSGRAVQPKNAKPSAETLLHCQIYKNYEKAGCVLHTHSVYGTLISLHTPSKALVFQGYEMLKAFRGISSHEHRKMIPVFDNNQDMKQLSHDIDERLTTEFTGHCYLIRGHGAYVWGRTVKEARRHAEALEFLLECEYRKRIL